MRNEIFIEDVLGVPELSIIVETYQSKAMHVDNNVAKIINLCFKEIRIY